MEVKLTPHKVQPLFYRPKSYIYCEISFDGLKWYTFKKENVYPTSWIKKFDYIIEHTDNELIKCDGFYDRTEKIIGFFDNRKIYNLYAGIIKRQKVKRKNQTFLLSDDEIRRKETMSLKDLDARKSGRMDLDDAPKHIFPTRIEAEWKERTNQQGEVQNCLYLEFFWEENEREVKITQMYTPWHMVRLVKRMKLMKIKDSTKHLAPMPWKLESEVFGGTGNPRYLPVQEAD